jgi:hypothetical protein
MSSDADQLQAVIRDAAGRLGIVFSPTEIENGAAQLLLILNSLDELGETPMEVEPTAFLHFFDAEPPPS